MNPVLAKEWQPTKNEKLTPDQVAPFSHKKVWWICAKGHEWEEMCKNKWPELKSIKGNGDAVLKKEIINLIVNDHPGLLSQDILIALQGFK